ncbi:MAG: metallophosphoesterase [Deltaproteobacteria bacterium]|nr:metallophosphoesterase [Deltaproteobacteria bacterium]
MKDKLGRRSLLVGSLAIGLTAADAWLIEPRWIEVERVDLPIQGLGDAWHEATVALLSDTHCGPYTEPSHIEHAVEIANGLDPDMVLLLGDYVHRGPKYIEPGIAPFAKLRAREGVFAVLGNHDHWDGRDLSLRELKRAGVDTLTNRSVVLRRRGDPLAIGGVGDLMEDVQLLEQAFSQCAQSTPRILMEHNPDYAEEMPRDVRVDLMVSGHTHGGQVRVPFYGAPILPSRYKKYQQGLVDGPACKVYVTRGVSTIAPPVRFLCRPEITLLRLMVG